MNRFHTLLLVSTLFIWGCSESAYNRVVPGVKASDEIDFGTVENSIYSNKYFGMTVKFPPDWSVQDKESQKRITKMGAELIAQGNSTAEAAIKAADLQTVNLFFLFEHPLGAPVKFNPNIICIAERIREMPGVKRGKDYLFHVRKGLGSGKIQYTFSDEVTTEKLGGRDFDVLHAEMPIVGMTVQQDIYAAVMKGYALMFTVSYENDEQKTALDKVLNTMTFK